MEYGENENSKYNIGYAYDKNSRLVSKNNNREYVNNKYDVKTSYYLREWNL